SELISRCTLCILFMYILPTLAILRRSLLHRIPLRSVMTTSVPLISRKDLTYLRRLVCSSHFYDEIQI
uniref:Secreted protein n=1 Tax=Haemonchus contortus TaxID=6289 RepID=A0A7I4Y0C8_HAECO